MSPQFPLLSIIIPAHNEGESIPETLKLFSSTLRDRNIPHEFIVVNDSSSDNTEQVIIDLQKNIPEIKLINKKAPSGFGTAVRHGLEEFSGDCVAVVMADGSDKPSDLCNYYTTFLNKKVDCVFGSRFIKGGRVIDYPIHKLILNRVVNFFIRILFGMRYNDTTNAFKLYSKETIDGLQPLWSHHFNLTVELPLKAIVRGYTYTIVPNTWENRKYGVSKLKIKEMGSRYLFIILYCLLEKWLSRGDYKKQYEQS